MIQHADKKLREEIDRQLDKPPAGVKSETIRATGQWAEGAAGNDFLAQMAARGGAGRLGARGVENVKTEQ